MKIRTYTSTRFLKLKKFTIKLKFAKFASPNISTHLFIRLTTSTTTTTSTLEARRVIGVNFKRRAHTWRQQARSIWGSTQVLVASLALGRPEGGVPLAEPAQQGPGKVHRRTLVANQI